VAAIPDPMLAQPGPLPTGERWAFELKLDGFRALVDTHDGLRVLSRPGWNMTDRVPELGALPEGLTLDGELVAWGEDEMPSWPQLGQRMLHGREGISVTLFVFDVLRVEGHDTMCLSYVERRAILDALELPRVARVLDSYNDGPCLFEAVCRSGFEGVVAKRQSDPYRPGRRDWVKTKNREYWRYPVEVAAMASSDRPIYASGGGEP
jgi:bifunctional non-homologous end joining protein LigD